LAEAMASWSRRGSPTTRPRDHRTARRRAIDRCAVIALADRMARLRADRGLDDGRRTQRQLAARRPPALIFTCCHPALRRPRVALTLRMLGG
jgi:predicted RNA polymerase sigma factor